MRYSRDTACRVREIYLLCRSADIIRTNVAPTNGRIQKPNPTDNTHKQKVTEENP